LKGSPEFYAGTAHHIGFSVTDSGGFDIPLGTYLAENMHINIVSQDTTHYHHLHTNYGMIGTDGHAGHSHSALPSSVGFGLISVAHAQEHDHSTHDHGTGAMIIEEVPESMFAPKDLRIQFAFPQPGYYKIFSEFVTRDNPDEVLRAEYWVKVNPAQVVSHASPLPKWALALISIILIGAAMPFIFRYLNEEKIKV
jgi:hypothetical protein